MKRSDLAVALVSGGMDSLVTVAEAVHQGYRMALLHASYGQRTQRRELQAFKEIVAHYKPVHSRRIDLSWLGSMGGSSLTDASIPVAVGGTSAGIPASYVPFRNAILLSAAVAWAEALGASAVFIGAVEEDSSGYPDCRESFFRQFEEVIRLGTGTTKPIRIDTPVIHLSKGEIVRRGVELDAPLHLSWSCYRDDHLACGVCDSCRLRIRAFRQAGVPDPIPYAIDVDWEKEA